MSFQILPGFISSIADDPAATAAGYLTPSRHNLPATVSGATVGGIPYCPTAASIVTGSGLVFNASGAAGDGLAIAAGTATTDVQALSVTQTWNASGVAFTGYKYTVTDTASAAGALHSAWYGGSAGTTALMTLNKGISGGAGKLSVGALTVSSDLTGTTNSVYLASGFLIMDGANGFVLRQSGTAVCGITTSVMQVETTGGLLALGGTVGSPDAGFSRLSAGLIALGNATNGSFAGRLKLTSTIVAGVAVGSLNASPTIGEVQSVTDALAPAAGSAVAAGGSAKALVWYNGAQWTVIGI